MPTTNELVNTIGGIIRVLEVLDRNVIGENEGLSLADVRVNAMLPLENLRDEINEKIGNYNRNTQYNDLPSDKKVEDGIEVVYAKINEAVQNFRSLVVSDWSDTNKKYHSTAISQLQPLMNAISKESAQHIKGRHKEAVQTPHPQPTAAERYAANASQHALSLAELLAPPRNLRDAANAVTVPSRIQSPVVLSGLQPKDTGNKGALAGEEVHRSASRKGISHS